MGEKFILSDLHSNDFLHPWDKAALEAVKKVPMLDQVINWMNKISYEKIFRLQSMGDDIRVTRKTCRSIWDMVEHCAYILNMHVPDVFINRSAEIDASANGTDAPMIHINAGTIDLLEDDELLVVIAREMGHIKCGHVLYRMAAMAMQSWTSLLGPMKVVTDTTLALSLWEWERKSELSADRAALLVSQDIRSVINVLMKLAGGSKKIKDQIDYNEFLEQSKHYLEMEKGVSGKLYKIYLNVLRGNPFPVMRAAEIAKWHESVEYQEIMKRGQPISSLEARLYSTSPSNFEAYAEVKNSIHLRWEAPEIANIAGYNLYRSNNEYEDFELVHTINERGKTQFIDQGLESATRYFYCLKARDLYNQESQATPIIWATTISPPQSIETIQATDGLVREVEVFWEIEYELSPGNRVFVFRRGEDENEFKHIGSVDHETTRYHDSNLNDGKLYYYFVVVENGGLFSEKSNTVYSRTKPLLDAPSNFSVKVNGDHVDYQWSDVQGAAFYTVYSKQFLGDKELFQTKETGRRVFGSFKPGKKFKFIVKTTDEYGRESEKFNLFLLET